MYYHKIMIFCEIRVFKRFFFTLLLKYACTSLDRTNEGKSLLLRYNCDQLLHMDLSHKQKFRLVQLEWFSNPHFAANTYQRFSTMPLKYVVSLFITYACILLAYSINCWKKYIVFSLFNKCLYRLFNILNKIHRNEYCIIRFVINRAAAGTDFCFGQSQHECDFCIRKLYFGFDQICTLYDFISYIQSIIFNYI